MNCRDFEINVLGRDRGEGVDDLSLKHADSCGACHGRLEAVQELRASLRDLAAYDELMEAPPHVEAALLKTLRGDQEPVSADLARTPFARAPRLKLALAAAAALMAIAIAASIIYTRSDKKTPMQVGLHQPGGSVPKEPAPNSDLPASNQGGGGTGERVRQRNDPENQVVKYRGPAGNKSTKGRGATGRERKEGYEIATDYFPIDLGSYLQPLDGGRVLRIKLPRSALRNYGLPVDPLRADEAVKADVVIGDDGMARAIRFVR